MKIDILLGTGESFFRLIEGPANVRLETFYFWFSRILNHTLHHCLFDSNSSGCDLLNGHLPQLKSIQEQATDFNKHDVFNYRPRTLTLLDKKNRKAPELLGLRGQCGGLRQIVSQARALEEVDLQGL